MTKFLVKVEMKNVVELHPTYKKAMRAARELHRIYTDSEIYIYHLTTTLSWGGVTCNDKIFRGG